MKELNIVVSGGSRGLGGRLVERLVQNHRVATFSRSSTSLVEELGRRNYARFLWRAVDGNNIEALKAFVCDVTAQLGPIDVLINCAAVGTEGLLSTMQEDEIQDSLKINLEMPLQLIRLCSKSMLIKGKGCIINVSSINGIRGHSGLSVYSAAKSGLDAVSRSLARELGRANIRVNSVAPGYFESEMTENLEPHTKDRIIRRTPLGRLGTVDDMVKAILFLISEDASFITGQTIVVDGGATC